MGMSRAQKEAQLIKLVDDEWTEKGFPKGELVGFLAQLNESYHSDDISYGHLIDILANWPDLLDRDRETATKFLTFLGRLASMTGESEASNPSD